MIVLRRALVLVGFLLPTVATAGEGAFANLVFGATEADVRRTMQANVTEGVFGRSCYDCPVHVLVDRYELSVTPEFIGGRLASVVLAYEQRIRTKDTHPALREPWDLLRRAISSKYGAGEGVGSFPDLPGAVDAAGAEETVTHRWKAKGKELRLGIAYETGWQRTRHGLREQMERGLLFGSERLEVKVVTYRVGVRIVDPAALPSAGAPEAGGAASADRIEGAARLF